MLIGDFGYQTAFLWFGIGQGGIILLLSPLLQGAAARPSPCPAAAAACFGARLHPSRCCARRSSGCSM
jgi:hypothetical protein